MPNGFSTTASRFSRRKLLAYASATGAAAFAPISSKAAGDVVPYGNGTLPAGVRARLIPNVNGLTVHVLEAGFETPGRPMVLLLHGFPNLAYSWRKQMPALAAAGYYAVAPDCRGFGRTTGWDTSFDADPAPFTAVGLVRDQIALVYALGYRATAMIVGHDQGAQPAALAALIRPDIFPRLTLIGGGGGGPSFPFNTANGATPPHPLFTNDELDAAYAKLAPPRKGYAEYWATREADNDMRVLASATPSGMTGFFRGFYYMKSGDFPGNQNLQPMQAVKNVQEAAEQNAKMPEYYVMRRDRSMPATVAAFAPSGSYGRNCKWLTDAECAVYGDEYTRSGWTGALHVYRHRLGTPASVPEQLTFSGRTVDVPAQIISGKQDWGANRQVGGPTMAGKSGFTQFKGVHMIDHAGHWTQEEQPEQVSALLTAFLRDNA